MAWLEERGNQFHLCVRIGRRKLKRSLKTVDPKEAETLLARAERRLRLIDQGDVELPDDADLLTFILSDGRREYSVRLAKPVLTLKELISQFRDALPDGTMESNSRYTLNIHLEHVLRVLKPNTAVTAVTFEALQRYVTARSQAIGRRGQPMSPTTIKKELSSFSSVWSWAMRMGHASTPFPNKGLRFAKTSDKPPFQTWMEIERQIACGGLSETEQAALWDCLYLRVEEIAELLAFVKDHAVEPCLYPMLLMAAHTGARRSEIVRAQQRDFDFVSGTVLIRECKRAKGRRTHRSVPLTDELSKTLQAWVAGHPGAAAFMEDGAVLTPMRASELLSRTILGCRWERLRGWHVLRHSFISNLASRSIDQRLIDEFVGHTTESMRQRYRHLFPETKRAAISAVFG
jgi:integrase